MCTNFGRAGSKSFSAGGGLLLLLLKGQGVSKRDNEMLYIARALLKARFTHGLLEERHTRVRARMKTKVNGLGCLKQDTSFPGRGGVTLFKLRSFVSRSDMSLLVVRGWQISVVTEGYGNVTFSRTLNNT